MRFDRMEALNLVIEKSKNIDSARRLVAFAVACVTLAASSWGSGITGKTFALSVLVGVGVHLAAQFFHGLWSKRRFATLERDYPSPDKGKGSGR